MLCVFKVVLNHFPLQGTFFVIFPQKGVGKIVYFLSVLENMQDVCGDCLSFSHKILCVCLL